METILQYIPAVLSAILLAVLILMVITNIIVEVVKKLTWDKVPTNLLAFIVAMAVTLLAFFAVCRILAVHIVWYMVAAAIGLGFFVAVFVPVKYGIRAVRRYLNNRRGQK